MAEPKDQRLVETSDVVGTAKSCLGIAKENSELSDDEIRRVCRWVGEHAPDTKVADGEVVFGTMGIEAMLFIALTEFPEFYQKYELSPID